MYLSYLSLSRLLSERESLYVQRTLRSDRLRSFFLNRNGVRVHSSLRVLLLLCLHSGLSGW